jgi:hypothetical protein
VYRSLCVQEPMDGLPPPPFPPSLRGWLAARRRLSLAPLSTGRRRDAFGALCAEHACAALCPTRAPPAAPGAWSW